jgi:TetR/AcrR family transcriptional regulator of autoinduction and epiphytic fitness
MVVVEVKKGSAKPSSRREKAAATRRRILDAAQQLFSEYGYAGTTMQAIADQADVAVQTVYFVFHTKGELLRQLLQTVGGRPEDPTETMERDWVDEAMTGPDGRRSIALMVEHGSDIYARVAPVWAAVGQGASVEPEVADVWRGIVEQRRKGIRRIVESLDARGQLRESVNVDRAADIVYGLHRPETLAVFVGERGWPLEDYKEWSYNTLCHQLLRPQPTNDQEQSPTRGLTFDRELP